MKKKDVPVEIAGFRTVQIYVVDDIEGMAVFRWYSVSNDTHADTEFAPWEEDDCPF